MFKQFSQAVYNQFSEMSKSELFVVGNHEIGDDLYQHYLASFPEGTNPIYKTNTEHDCTCCKQFIRNLGRVVSIKDGQVITVWDVQGLPSPYQEVADALASFIKTVRITSVFRSKEPSYGAEETLQRTEDGVKKWNHFYGKVAAKHRNPDADSARGQLNTAAQVFKRGLEELTLEAIDDVLSLIEQKALYRGEEHLKALKEFRKCKSQYDSLPTKKERHLFVWENLDTPAYRFRNTVIGTLVTDISNGEDLEKAVRSFEVKVAPTNYKRPTALITPAMIKNAMSTLTELNLESALHRRHAKLSDVSVNNVLWVDNESKSVMKDAGGFEAMLLTEAAKTAPKGKAEHINIEDFMSKVLPSAVSMELMVANRHEGNLVSITAPIHQDAGRLFKWDNPFAWSYNGNLTDSIAEKVKAAGGNVDSKLRFSLAWWNHDDLDLYVTEPNEHEICFYEKKSRYGCLDVDMNVSPTTRTPVENVAFHNPLNGTYTVKVNQYRKREVVDVGFTIEVAAGNDVKQYSYKKAATGMTTVGTFTFENGVIIKQQLNSEFVGEGMSKEKWGIHTEVFTPVHTVMFSPNHWDGQAVGNKHWFFILKRCMNDMPVRGIYNEFLNSNMEQHRKVFEVLGDKTKCQPSDEQLSGVGFSSTKSDSVVVKVQTKDSQRLYEIKFN